MQVVLNPCGFARLHGLFTLLRREGLLFDGHIARPSILELAALITFAMHLARRMDVPGTNPEAASATAPAAARAPTGRRTQRIWLTDIGESVLTRGRGG
jgi:hypothetical protein